TAEVCAANRIPENMVPPIRAAREKPVYGRVKDECSNPTECRPHPANRRSRAVRPSPTTCFGFARHSSGFISSSDTAPAEPSATLRWIVLHLRTANAPGGRRGDRAGVRRADQFADLALHVGLPSVYDPR